MRLIVWMTQEIFKMHQYAVDIPMLPVNLCFSHLIQFLEECKAVLWECRAAEKGRQAFGTRMVYRETFLQIQLRLLQHLIRRSWIHWSSNISEHTSHMWWVRTKHQFRIRDELQDRQPEVQSSPVREILLKNYGADQQWLQSSDLSFWQIHHVSNVRLLEDQIQDWGMYLYHNFLRNLCCGSKKWRWLNQWMISNLRVLSQELLVHTLSCLTRELLQHWTKTIQNARFKKKVSVEEMKPHKEDRFLRGRHRLHDLRVLPGHWGQRFCRE